MPVTILNLLLIAVFILAPLFTLNAKAQTIVCPLPSIMQVTFDSEEDSQRPSVSDDGVLVAFESESNINGGNPNSIDQIYLYNTITKNITQITAGNDDSTNAQISSDGNRIVFQSSADLGGFNSNGQTQVYIYDIPSGVFTQITSNGNFGSTGAHTDFTGSMVAFSSEADHTGQNPDNNFEIFLYNVATATLTQITMTSPPEQSFPGGFSADGSMIVIGAEANFNGGNPILRRQIFYYTVATGQFTQVTFGDSGFSSNPTINNAGTRIAFNSSSNLEGLNPSGRLNIFVFDIPSGEFMNITNNTEEISRTAEISGDGLRVVFQSSANLTGNNPNGEFQIYVYDIVSGDLAEITSGPNDPSENGSLNFTGEVVAFQSEDNIDGNNPENSDQIYVITCFDPATFRSIPTLSEWGLIAMAGLIGVAGVLFVIRRRAATI